MNAVEPKAVEPRDGVDTIAARRAASSGPGRDNRRRDIIDAAIAAIEEDGPQTLTAQIADRAGLARTHVYRHFASKEDLDLAVAQRAHRELTEQIRTTLEVNGSALDAIRAPLTQHVVWADEHPNLYQFLLDRGWRRSPDQPRVGGSALASEISAAAERYLPRLGVDKDGADALIVGILGLVDASLSWWLHHRDTTRTAFIERLTAQAWLIIDHRLRELGEHLDPDAPLAPTQNR